MYRKGLIFFLCIYSSSARKLNCPSRCSCTYVSINCSKKSLLSLNDIDVTSNNYDLIDVSQNKLDRLPPFTSNYLDASSNLIQEFPHVLPPTIHTLLLKSNQIWFAQSHTCPDSLKSLDLSENPIKELDLACGGLKSLNISNGDIETLPDQFLSTLKSLQVLNIDDNPLKKINGNLSSDTLEVLSLQRTQLRYIKPGTFCNLSKLKVINLSGNKFLHTLNLMSGTEIMIANHCSLETIDLSGMPRIRGLEINDNHINNLLLPDSVLELKASNNLLYGINLGKLKKADLSRNSILELHLHPMDILNISGNPIGNLRLSSIHYLDASQCKISKLESFGTKFHTLNLSHNSLEIFPENLSVRKLDVSFNRLSRFKSRIDGIEELWLTGNRFVLAEDVMAQGLMHLNDNPWTCDCKMDHLYMSAHDAKTLTCSHPKNVTGRTWHDACYKSRIPRWMLDRPYVPFIISTVLLILAMIFFYWLRKKLDSPSEINEEEERNVRDSATPEVVVNNQLPSYEEALLMPGISRKKNALTQTRSYEVLSRRLSSNSI